MSAVFVAAAVFCLIDGLYSSVRVGSEVLELLPGQTLMVSGPSPLKNPLNSDFSARITPPGEDVRFILEGFFASYWFGSAMWRGAVRADAGAEPGRRELLIRFRGAPAKSAQKFLVHVWESESVKRAEDPSVLRRLTGVTPAMPGIACGVAGLLFGAFTFFWGRRYLKNLSGFGCSEVFRTDITENERRVFCLANDRKSRWEGVSCRIFSPEGEEIGQAVAQKADKGILEFSMPKDAPVSAGCLVELRRRAK
ncbi:MAG: hypothetical protein LBN96_05050 [Desulfovibrio sp.]|nr:hypothetical protein [Desulfovibrio sp.]